MGILIEYTLIFSIVLIIVAYGGMFSERGGVINLGLEGIMLFGATAGAITMVLLPKDMAPFWLVTLPMLAAIAAGMLSSLLIAVACITFKADQTLIGTAVNMIAVALMTVMVKSFNKNISDGVDFSSTLTYIAGHDAQTIQIGNFSISVYLFILIAVIIAVTFIFYKSRFALRLIACGEHPSAADSVSINVNRMRYAGVLISGALAGLGGIIYISIANSSWDFKTGVAGAGFLALAVMIFGQWKPLRIAIVAVGFALFRALSSVYSGIPFLENLEIPGTVYNMLPYIVSLLVLALTSKKSRAPKAEGIPYDKSKR